MVRWKGGHCPKCGRPIAQKIGEPAKPCPDCTAAINKPSWDDAPDRAEWLAQDSGGMWYWYEDKPERLNAMWAGPVVLGWSPIQGALPAGHDWRGTLEQRPEAKPSAVTRVSKGGGGSGSHVGNSENGVLTGYRTITGPAHAYSHEQPRHKHYEQPPPPEWEGKTWPSPGRSEAAQQLLKVEAERDALTAKVEAIKAEAKDWKACAQNWEANAKQWDDDWHTVKKERDALAAHLERIIREWISGDDKFSDEWINRMGDIVEDAPETSLAHLKAKWQAEALGQLAAIAAASGESWDADKLRHHAAVMSRQAEAKEPTP